VLNACSRNRLRSGRGRSGARLQRGESKRNVMAKAQFDENQQCGNAAVCFRISGTIMIAII
jgi:hypothetical protein